MPEIVFMDMDGNEIRKDISEINSVDDIKKNVEDLLKKKNNEDKI